MKRIGEMVVGRIVFYDDHGKATGSRDAVSGDLGCSKSAHIFVTGARKCWCGRVQAARSE